MMPVKVGWNYDADTSIADAQGQNRLVLLDFSATPG